MNGLMKIAPLWLLKKREGGRMELSSGLYHLRRGRKGGLRLMMSGVLIRMHDPFPPCNIQAAPLKMQGLWKVEPKGRALPSGQVPTHFRAPRPFSGQAGPRASAPFPGLLKVLLPPALGVEMPPLKLMQLPQALWFCSCSRGRGHKRNREVITF